MASFHLFILLTFSSKDEIKEQKKMTKFVCEDKWNVWVNKQTKTRFGIFGYTLYLKCMKCIDPFNRRRKQKIINEDDD